MRHAPETDPDIALVRQYLHRVGIERRLPEDSIIARSNLAGAVRRVDELLRRKLQPAVLERIADSLGVSASHLEVAREPPEAIGIEDEREAERLQAEATMERRGPHLWGRTPENYHTHLISVLNPEFWLMVRVPRKLLELPDCEQLEEVGCFARNHYENRRLCRLVGYDFRRSLHEVFRFDNKGEYLGRFDSVLSGSRSFVRIKGQELDTTEEFFPPDLNKDEG